MGKNKIYIRMSKDGEITIDIPDAGSTCEVMLDDIISSLDGIIPEGEVRHHAPKEKDVLEVNIGYNQ